MVRLGSIVMIAALLIGASSAIVLGANEARADCVPTLNGCGGGGGAGPVVGADSVLAHAHPSAAASAALDGLNGVGQLPPPIPQVAGTAVEYAVMLALIIVVCITST